MVDSLATPQCFACKYWGDPKDPETDDLEQLWNSSRLERAHIIADSLGGRADQAKNFLLLCRRCHRDAPMTNRRNAMLEWVRHRQTFWQWFYQTVIRAFHDYGITPEDFAYLNSLGSEEIIDRLESMDIDAHPQARIEGLISSSVACLKQIADDQTGQRFLAFYPLPQ